MFEGIASLCRRRWPLPLPIKILQEKVAEEKQIQENSSSIFLDTGDVFRIGLRIAVFTGKGVSFDYPDKSILLDYKLVDTNILVNYQTPLGDAVRVKKGIVKIDNFEEDSFCKPYLEKIKQIRYDLEKARKLLLIGAQSAVRL